MIDSIFEFYKDRPPENLAKLFAITKKREAVKFCHELVLQNSDISHMIMGCGSLGYIHSPVFEDNNVDHLWKSAPEKIQTPSGLRQLHKQLTQESSRSIFHFFVRDGEPEVWHVLTWDSRDSRPDGQFVHGAHVHFINHLWVKPTINEIIAAIPKRPHGAHIKTQPEE
jgi:hypothetical protein